MYGYIRNVPCSEQAEVRTDLLKKPLLSLGWTKPVCLAESSSLSRERSLSCVKYVGDEWKSSGEERMEAANEGNLNWGEREWRLHSIGAA